MGRATVITVIAALAAALATALVLRMLEIESNAAVIGGSAGAVSATIFVAMRNRRRGSKQS